MHTWSWWVLCFSLKPQVGALGGREEGGAMVEGADRQGGRELKGVMWEKRGK